MAKKILTQASYLIDKIQSLADQVKNQAPLLKQDFDYAAIETKKQFNDVTLPELQDSTNGTSGSYAIGHGSDSITADNVGDALEENRQAITDAILGQIPDNSLTPTKMTPLARTLFTNKAYLNTGTSDALVITTDGEADYAEDNWIVIATPLADNTGAVTLNVDGKGVKNTRKVEDGAYVILEAEDLKNLVDATFRWSVSNDFFVFAPKGAADEWGDLKFNPVTIDLFGRIYSCDSDLDEIQELDQDTKIKISSASSPSTTPRDVGGINSRLYHCDNISGFIYELDVNTKLPISNATSPSSLPYGVGGIDSRLYHCDNNTDLVYELDPTTKLSLSNAGSPNTNPTGIGGLESRLYHTDESSNSVYELDINTKLQISSASGPSTNPRGIGGVNSRLYLVDSNVDKVYELDIDTKLQISSNGSPGAVPRGMGGIKSNAYTEKRINIETVTFNGTTYELTDDSPFRVQGVSV